MYWWITVFIHEATVDAGAVRESAGGVAWVTAQDLRDFGVSSMTKKALAGEVGR
jgi:hypothetical protein